MASDNMISLLMNSFGTFHRFADIARTLNISAPRLAEVVDRDASADYFSLGAGGR